MLYRSSHERKLGPSVGLRNEYSYSVVVPANGLLIINPRWFARVPLLTKVTLKIYVFQGLQLKGQMVFCPESDSLLFIGSPFLDGLEGLTGRGLFISDIPLHDATRDVILVGEQARAQVSLFIFLLPPMKSVSSAASLSINRLTQACTLRYFAFHSLARQTTKVSET